MAEHGREDRPIRAIVLDFNGTLVQDDDVVAPLYIEIFASVGVPLTVEEFQRDLAALPDRELIDQALARAGLPADDPHRDELLRARLDGYLAAVEHIQPIDDAAIAFVKAAAERVTLAIASGAYRREIDYVLGAAGVSGYFQVIVSIDDVADGKPHPETFTRALQRLNETQSTGPPIEPHEAVAIEDTTGGARAAREAGMHVVAIRGAGYDATSGHADVIVARLDPLALETALQIPRLARVLEQVPQLGSERVVTPIAGGMTNHNYRVRSDRGDHVVRVGVSQAGQLGIDRANEYRNSVRAWHAGVGVPVVARVAEPEALIVEYVTGRTLEPQDFRDPRRISVLAALLRRLHCSEPFELDFDMVAVQRRYHEIVTEHGYPLPDDYGRYADRARLIGELLTRTRVRTTPCHNDLMPGNFIESEGPGSRIWLVDYEYSGNNDPAYDLGDAINELLLDAEQAEQLVSEYGGGPDPRELARARLWSLMSKYGWCLWGSIRVGTSGDREIHDWTQALWERAVTEFDSPELDELIARAGAGE